MQNNDQDDTALVDIQIRLSEMERTLQELSETVHDQWGQIDKLTRINKRLAERLEQLEYRVPDQPQDEAPPPHY